jgi:hypothetical protein
MKLKLMIQKKRKIALKTIYLYWFANLQHIT